MKKTPCIHENLTVTVAEIQEHNAYEKEGVLIIAEDYDLVDNEVRKVTCNDCGKSLPKFKKLDREWK